VNGSPNNRRYGRCAECNQEVQLTQAGMTWRHPGRGRHLWANPYHCPGSGQPPKAKPR
jgi:hypothetical protein